MSGPLPSGPPPGLGYIPASGGGYGRSILNAQMQASVLGRTQMLPQAQAARGWTDALPREKPRIGELVGYRAWLVEADRLYSITMLNEWTPGEVMSDRCHAGLEITDHNYVGIWAFNNPGYLHSQFWYKMEICGVFGTIWMWGTVIEHERGYRAQYASIRSLDKAPRGIDLEALRAIYLREDEQ